MSPNAPVAGSSPAHLTPSALRTPPEERFWKRYSPHGELSLSGVGSLAVHALVLGTLVLWSWLLWNKFNNWRIYWSDHKPESVAGVMDALGLQGMHPSHFVAFMPQKLEEKLFDLELKCKGLREDEIHETMFEVIKTARGYEPRVIDQVPKSAVGR